MTKRTTLISDLLYGVFSAGKKKRKCFPISTFGGARGHSRSCSRNRENPGRAIETRRDSRNSFFENETIFVFIKPRSWANLALKKNFHNAQPLQENNARSERAYYGSHVIMSLKPQRPVTCQQCFVPAPKLYMYSKFSALRIHLVHFSPTHF